MPGVAPWVIHLVAGAWGAIWGSFGNVVIVRLPERRSIVRPASHCPACGKDIRWYDNIPIASWILLRGRCRHCGWHIPLHYPLVEAGSALLAVLVVRRLLAQGPDDLALLLSSFFVQFAFLWALLVLSVIDLRTMLLPDAITLPGVLLSLAFVLLTEPGKVLEHALASAGAYLAILLLFVLAYRLIAKREGMGMGDAKLLAMIGAMLGWKGVLFSLVGGAALGLVLNLPVLLAGKASRPDAESPSIFHTQLPFGPMLSLAAFLFFFWGDGILGAYYSLVDRIVLSFMR